MNKLKEILIIDLEATCWNGIVPVNQKSEIIEIGICLLNVATGEITGNRGILIKPSVSEVSEFCTQLTTITTTQLEKEGIDFKQACNLLSEQYQAKSLAWASYGDYDRKMMQRQCDAFGVHFPLSEDHINVKELFYQKKKLKRKVGMDGALQMLGLSLDGTHHRGVDDAKNIARILRWCFHTKE